MALCLLVQVQRTLSAPSESELQAANDARTAADEAFRRELTASRQAELPPGEVLGAMAEQAAGEKPSLDRLYPPTDFLPGAQGQSPDTALAAVRAGTLGSDSNPYVAAIHAADHHFLEIEQRDVVYRFGYRAADGFSIRLLLCAFVHGGWIHLVGNLIFLWLCGCNLEDRWGSWVFAGFYLLSALAASLAFAVIHPSPDTLLIGASGAIAGAMGAFLVCYARARIKWIYLWGLSRGFRVMYTPAYVAFPAWFVLQVFQAWLESHGVHGGVAYSAHVGGFAFGAAIALGMRMSGVEAKVLLPAIETKEGGWEEHPDFLRAIDRGKEAPEEAMGLLRKVLHENPTHDEARIELARLAIALGDSVMAMEVLPRALAKLARDDRFDELMALVRAAEGAKISLGASKPGDSLPPPKDYRSSSLPPAQGALDECAWFGVVRAAFEVGDPSSCVRYARGFQAAFPRSSELPTVLYCVAHSQAKAGRSDLAEKTFARLASEYPTHALAVEARKIQGA